MKEFYSNGKLLIAGEYVVLDGALAFAVPTKFGQSLKVEPINESKIHWKSFNSDNTIWFESEFEIRNGKLSDPIKSDDTSKRIVQILNTASSLNPNFLNPNTGFKITTALTFPKNWGLGTSSTLINNIANWAQVDAYKLLKNTFGGSGYDIACAQNDQPVIFQRNEDRIDVSQINFNPYFKKHIYFVYLNKKQNSRDEIASYNVNKTNISLAVSEINDIIFKIVRSESLKDFETLLIEHENIISKVIKRMPVKELLFNDFNGCVKSLGAWGGDFVLITATENPESYFKNKGFETIIPFSDMVL